MRNIRRVSLALCAFAFSALTASAARADAPGDAWAAAKGLLPANAAWVGGINVATIKSSTIFQQLYPKLVEQSGEAKNGLEMMKTDCGINVTEAIQGVVIAMDDAEKGIIVVSTKGVDQAKINDCLSKAAAKEKKQISAGKPDAMGIVEYTTTGEKDKIYVAFLPKGVVAMSTEPKDKSMLQKWLGGKGLDGKSTLGAAVGKVNTGAAIWGAVAKSQEIEPGKNLKAGYGSADLGGGNITADIHVVMGSPKEASDMATEANTKLEEAKKGNQIPPAMVNIIKSVRISSVGEELQVKASMAEKEALGLIGMAMGGGGAPH